jgi:outer membrane scaffolding protein for murein synthesis (MipA/OmpV family)
MILWCSQSFAVQPIEWELGAGFAAFDVPLYPGSAENKQYLFPVPYATLRSEFLDVDEGIRAKLFHQLDLRLLFSADVGVPVSSADSEVRAGMPDLSTVFQLGPLLEFSLGGGRNEGWQLRLELPARLAFATDFKSVDNLGVFYEPRLTYETRQPYRQGFEWQLTTGLRYAEQAYHAYYYAVAAQFASAQRPAYVAQSGYGGVFADLAASWRSNDVIYWTFVRYQGLSAAVFADSPLVEQADYYFVGAGISWILLKNF